MPYLQYYNRMIVIQGWKIEPNASLNVNYNELNGSELNGLVETVT